MAQTIVKGELDISNKVHLKRRKFQVFTHSPFQRSIISIYRIICRVR